MLQLELTAAIYFALFEWRELWLMECYVNGKSIYCYLVRYQIQGSPAIDTVCITIEDYYRDFLHLRKDFFARLLQELEIRVVAAYMRALIER